MILAETLGTNGWPGGVVPATDPTLLDAGASPRGLNSALALATAGTPFVQKRMGLRTINPTPVSGSPALIGGYDYYRIADTTHRQMVVSDGGRIDLIALDGTITNITTGLTAGANYPDFSTANDLAFVVNGIDAKKYDGTTLTSFGVTRPTVGSMAGAAGAAGSPNGTYELRVTFANSLTAAESSASETAASTVTVANQKISWSNIPVSSDAQVDTRYLYVRNTATQTQFYRAGTINDNTSTTATTDFADANLVTLAPSTTENNPPPAGIRYIAFHQGRMFAATHTALYYSKVNLPEAFPPENVEYVNDSDGQQITGLISDHEILIVFKEDRFYGVFNGNDPASWEVRLISSDFGCANHRTIVTTHAATCWWSRHGLVLWDGASEPNPVGLKLYGDPTDRINYTNIATASSAIDEQNARVIVALPGAGQSRATILLPFNIILGRFESDYWDPMDCASLATGVDSDQGLRIYFGNYAGQMFRLWDTNSDGVDPLTTSTGTFVATGGSTSTITDLTATFDTTGGGLIERKVTVLDADGVIISGSNRPHITSNTTTALTLSTSVDGLTVGATYTYIVGGPDFQWDTTWRAYALPWVKKRFEYLFLLIKGVSYGASAKIDVAYDWDDGNANSKQQTFSSSALVGTWDDPLTTWDVSVWDAASNLEQRFRMARVGRSHRVRVRNAAANQPFALLMLGTQAVGQTTKR